MMMMPDFSAPHAAEKFLGPIRASAVEAVSIFVIDPLDFKARVKRIP